MGKYSLRTRFGSFEAEHSYNSHDDELSPSEKSNHRFSPLGHSRENSLEQNAYNSSDSHSDSHSAKKLSQDLNILNSEDSSSSPWSLRRSNSPSMEDSNESASVLKVKDVHGQTRVIHLTADRIRSLFHLAQPEAAQSLGIGLSTLKKHSRLLLDKGERWPNQRQRSRIIMEKNSQRLKISSLIHDEEISEKDLSGFHSFVAHSTPFCVY